MRKLTTLTLLGSVSNEAGGLFHSVRETNINLMRSFDFLPIVMAPEDRSTFDAIHHWFPVPVEVTKRVGPYGLGFSPQLYKKCLNKKADLLHLHGLWMYPSYVCLKYVQKYKVPYVISPRGMLDEWAINNSNIKKKLALLLYEANNISKCSIIHALSETEAKSIRSLGFKNKICVIPNGVNLPDDLKIKPKLDNREKNLLFLGRIHPKKNLENLIHAWVKFFKDNKKSGQWNLLIAGWDQLGYESKLKQILNTYNNNINVKFLGPKFGAEKSTLLSMVDAFILPSLSEGLPMSVLEAFSYKLPVLMTDYCNFEDGFLCGGGHRIGTGVDEIFEGISWLSDLNQADINNMGSWGYDLVRSKYTWHEISRKTSELYNFLLGSSGGLSTIYDKN